MISHRPEYRARTVALIGLAFEVILSAFFVVLTVWGKSEALRALSLLTGTGNLVWLFLVLIYHQRVLVQEEAFETEQLRRERASGAGTETIFDVADEQLLLARRRLQWMYRWVLPVFTVAVIGLLALSGLAYWTWSLGISLRAEQWVEIERTTTGLLMWFVGGTAFVTFLLSRYATGMARQPEWRMLHAGAAWLMGVTLSAALLTAALGALHFFKTPIPERIIAYGLRILLILLGGEVLLNFVLDFYRPRAADEEPRPAFDSRLLGLFTEPGGIARSIAEAINYQFGFEVSSTWFYKLLQRSVLPLVGFAVATLLAADGFVFVEADQQSVIELFGHKQRVLGPGLHAKWPWPIEIAYHVATAQIHETKIGIRSDEDKRQEGRDDLILWTNKHSAEPHLDVLVAAPKVVSFGSAGLGQASRPAAATTQPGEAKAATQTEAVPVNQLRVSVVIQYQIRDAYQWLRTFKGPEAALDSIAKREITRFCAGIDAPHLLGGERGAIERTLWQAIQRSADEKGLGIDIRFLGLQGLHPPFETAGAYQSVIGAESKGTASVRSARADRNRRLAETAGNVERAEQLAQAISRLNELEANPKSAADELKQVKQRVHELFFGDSARGVRPVGGLAAQKMTSAREKRWQLENRAHGRAAAFDAEIATANAAPKHYRMRKYLEMLVDAVPGIRKYVIVAEALREVRTFHLNLQDARDIPLDVAIQKKD